MTDIYEIITFDNFDYINASDLYVKDKAFFHGCSNNDRNIIIKIVLKRNMICLLIKKR